jgi:hypothetical protein
MGTAALRRLRKLRLSAGGAVALGQPELEQHVIRGALVGRRRAGSGAGQRIDAGRQRLVVHADGVQGVLGQVAIARHRHGHRIAGVGRLAQGQQALARERQPGLHARQPAGGGVDAGVRHGRQLGQVGAGQRQGHAWQRPRCSQIDGPDAGVGVRAAQDGGRQQARRLEVADILAAASQQASILTAKHGHQRTPTARLVLPEGSRATYGRRGWQLRERWRTLGPP